MMREYRDVSRRLSIELSGDGEEFGVFADRMISLHGVPVEKVSGLDQRYWDFDVDGVTIVLHSDTMAGVSIHVDDGTHEEVLRALANELKENK
jgi:hypothetical protein